MVLASGWRAHHNNSSYVGQTGPDFEINFNLSTAFARYGSSPRYNDGRLFRKGYFFD
jgi:hypothetical protein